MEAVDVSPINSGDVVLEDSFLQIGGGPAKVEVAANQIADVLAGCPHREMHVVENNIAQPRFWVPVQHNAAFGVAADI